MHNAFHYCLRCTLLVLAVVALPGQAQQTRYISDNQLIPVRSGAGNNYRIINRGLPSGTRLTVHETSEDGVWARITTDSGEEGWLRAQYLMAETPAKTRLARAEAKTEQLRAKNEALNAQLATLQSEHSNLSEQASASDSSLSEVSAELAQLKQISGRAVQLDSENRRLTEDNEALRAEVDTMKAEGQRLQDKLQKRTFLHGAFAVLLGVIITLLVPRLWPKRRRNDGWA